MARSGITTANYLITSSAGVTTTPLTLACWARHGTGSSNQTMISVSRAAAASGADLYALQTDGSSTGKVRASANDSGTAVIALSTIAAPVDNSWFHAAAVFASTTSRSAYLNGGSKGTNTTSKTLGTPDRMIIGVNNATPGAAWNSGGAIAEAAIWNVALSDTEIALLAAGALPPTVRPDALVGYWPLTRESSQSEPNHWGKGQYRMSNTGTVTAAAHPRIIMPKRRIIT